MENIENGIYHYEQGNNPYDMGNLVIEVKNTEKALQLKVIEKNMRFSSYVDVLFGDKDKANINKQRSPHAVNCGTDYFVVYPNRMGCPLCFVKGGANG